LDQSTQIVQQFRVSSEDPNEMAFYFPAKERTAALGVFLKQIKSLIAELAIHA
jgi:hypothetical protein